MSLLACNMAQMVPMVGAVCLSEIVTSQKLLKTSSNWGPHTTGKPGTANFTRSRHNTLPYVFVVNSYGTQGHVYGQG